MLFIDDDEPDIAKGANTADLAPIDNLGLPPSVLSAIHRSVHRGISGCADGHRSPNLP